MTNFIYFMTHFTYFAATLKTRLARGLQFVELDLSYYIRVVKARGTPVSANDPGGRRYMTSTNFLALRAN